TVTKHNGEAPLWRTLDHKELYEAHPDLKGVKVNFKDMPVTRKGQYDPNTDTITLNSKLSDEEVKSILLHETQHGIQSLNDWARGGNAAEFRGAYDLGTERLSTVESHLSTMDNQISDKVDQILETNYKTRNPELKAENNEIIKKAIAYFKDDSYVSELDVRSQIRQYLKEHDNMYKSLYKEQADLKYRRDKPFESYKKLLGEEESRATQAALKHPGVEPYQALAKEEGLPGKPIVRYDDVKMSSETPKPKDDKLYATHRTNINNLARMADGGKVPAPSFALSKNAKTSKDFGDIIIVPKEKHIDPKKGASVFGGDAWTPRVKFDANEQMEIIDLKAPVFDRLPYLKRIAKNAYDSDDFRNIIMNEERTMAPFESWGRTTGRDAYDLVNMAAKQIFKKEAPNTVNKIKAIKKLIKENDGDMRGLEDAFTPEFVYKYKQYFNLDDVAERGKELKTFKSKDKFYDEAWKALKNDTHPPADYMEAKRLDQPNLSDMSRIIVPAEQYDEVVAMMKEKGIDIPVVRQRVNETDNAAIKRSSDNKSNYIHTHESATGALYGFEQNEDGTYSYNLQKGLLGVAGAKLATKAITSKQMTSAIKKYGEPLKDALAEKGIESLNSFRKSLNTTTANKTKTIAMRQAFAHESLVSGIVGAGIGGGVGAYNSEDKEKGAMAGAVFGAIIGTSGVHAWSRWGRKAPVANGILPPETKLGRVQRALQNKFNRVQQLLEVKTNGNPDLLPDSINPVQAETLFHGRAENRMERFKESITKPLIKKLTNSKYTMDDLDDYLIARHAKERNAKMKAHGSDLDAPSGMTDDVADDILTEFDTPEMRGLAKYVDNMNEARLTIIENEGLESDDMMNMIRGSYENYVPLQRNMDEGEVIGGVSGKGYSNKTKEFKRARGSEREVLSPTVVSMINFQSTLVRSEKNKVGKAMLEFIKEYPDDALYTVKGVRHTPQYDKTGEIVGMNPNYQLKDNVMHVKVDGKVKEIEFKDAALAAAFKNLNAPQMGAVLRTAHKGIRYLASISTSYNPEFVISNFARDIQTAMANMPHTTMANEAKMVKDVLPAVKGILTGNGDWARVYKEFSANGAKTGWIDLMEVDSEIVKLNKEILMLEGKAPTRKMFTSFLEGIDHVNTSIENGVRLVAYKQMRDAGMSAKKAAVEAKELTVNFNKKGEMGTVFNTLYMFANASLQGSTRMLKALATSKKAKIGATALTSTAVGLHLYNISVNEDAYNDIPQYVKDTNLILMQKDGTYIKMILPYGYNVFKSAGDMIGEKWTNGEVRGGIFERIISTTANAFNPLGSSESVIHTLVPTLVKPLYEMQNNVNFFGANIKPDKPQYVADDKPDSQKYFKSVTKSSKFVTE
ncbi:MAG: hypothetical protein DRG30_06805, partial [Epsilonproteobacteria bacterium]